MIVVNRIEPTGRFLSLVGNTGLDSSRVRLRHPRLPIAIQFPEQRDGFFAGRHWFHRQRTYPCPNGFRGLRHRFQKVGHNLLSRHTLSFGGEVGHNSMTEHRLSHKSHVFQLRLVATIQNGGCFCADN